MSRAWPTSSEPRTCISPPIRSVLRLNKRIEMLWSGLRPEAGAEAAESLSGRVRVGYKRAVQWRHPRLEISALWVLTAAGGPRSRMRQDRAVCWQHDSEGMLSIDNPRTLKPRTNIIGERRAWSVTTSS